MLIVLTIIYVDIVYDPITQKLVEETGTIHNYFCKLNDCQHQLIKITNNSESLICAFYDITNKKLIEHLIEENAQIITHTNKKFEKINTQGLMHHKFCVINYTHTITGSYNPTQINNHHENLIIIESPTIANNYAQEYQNIQNLNNKKIKQKKQTTHTKIIFNNETLENYFCPQDECKKQIIQKIQQADKTINILLFTFTDKDVAKEIIKKHEQGVEVKGIIENFQNKKYWATPLLIDAGINIKIHSAEELQHNKIIIIDDVVITGSYNPTNAANTINDENILIIKQKEIVKEYKNYFDEVFESLE